MTIDERQVQRMVDGELDPIQQRELLMQCEQTDGWRDLALAYVESQVLQQTLQTPPWQAASGAPATGHLSPSAADTNRAGTRQAWALAASALFCLAIGYGSGWLLQDQDTSVPAPTMAHKPVVESQHGGTLASNEPGSPSAPPQLASPPKSMQVTVGDPSSGYRQLELPIVSASELGPDWRKKLSAELPADVAEQLQGSGVGLRRARTYTPVQLPDGRQVLVPVDHYFEYRYQ